MIASLKPVTDTYDFNSENGHYYRYIPQPSTWLEARDAAAADTYMGLQGYLVTVTSPEESKFITTIGIAPGAIAVSVRRIVIFQTAVFDNVAAFLVSSIVGEIGIIVPRGIEVHHHAH